MQFSLNSLLSGLSRALSGLRNYFIPTVYAPSAPPGQPGGPPASTAKSSSSSNLPLIADALSTIGSVTGLGPKVQAETQYTPSAAQLQYSGSRDVGLASSVGPSSYVGLGGYSAPQPASTPPAPTLPAGGFTSTAPLGIPKSLGGAGMGLGPGGGIGAGLVSNVSGGGVPGYGGGGIGISGQQAPMAGTAVPPPPVSVNIPTTPVGQYEAMVRALQKLSPGSYIQTPLEQTPAYGPGYGMGSALRRMREYQGLYK